MDLQGNQVILRRVPASYDERLGDYKVSLENLMAAEGREIAESHGVSPRAMQILLLVYAKPHFDTQITLMKVRGQQLKSGFLDQKFRLNKMLFQVWQELKKVDLQDYFVFDEFVAQRAGPVPAKSKEDLKELEVKGLLNVKWAYRAGESFHFEVTEKGQRVAQSIWQMLPIDAKSIFEKTKSDLYLIDAAELKHRFHESYPEYKKNYVELDSE